MNLPGKIGFDGWILDRSSGELTQDGTRVRLADQAFQILDSLLSSPGQVVTREHLITRLWPHGVVEFETSLNAAVRKLRAALGDDADSPRYIETLPRKGYRFIGRVSSPSTPSRDDAQSQPESNSKVDSLAVLPFKPLLPESGNAALELGMTDTLIARLSNLPDVVLSPLSSVRSYGAVSQDPLSAGRALRVAAVLDGSIQTDQRRIRVSARLLKVSDGRCLWSHQFDASMDDIFTVQDTIASQVVDALAVTLSAAAYRRMPRQSTRNSHAYQAYVSGLYKWQHRLPEAVADFEAAIRLDPEYSLAWSGLSNALAAQGVYGYAKPAEVFPKAKQAALRALAFDEELADAHDALGHVLVQYERRYAEGEECYRRAIQLRDNVGEYWQRLAIVRAYQGHTAQALADMRHAQKLEPTRLSFNANVAMMLYFERGYPAAISLLHNVLALDSRYDHAHTLMGRSLLEAGDVTGALRHFELRSRPTPGSDADMGRAYAKAGRISEAHAEVERLRQRGREGFGVGYSLAAVHVALAEHAPACSALELALQDCSQTIGFLQIDPALDEVRGSSSFDRVAQQVYGAQWQVRRAATARPPSGFEGHG
jgi:DNA-binding winged helix-turn-helix (wHTH) protein/Flp pilus assembly protein TadD